MKTRADTKLRGARAASPQFAAACREHLRPQDDPCVMHHLSSADVSGKLPENCRLAACAPQTETLTAPSLEFGTWDLEFSATSTPCWLLLRIRSFQ